MPIVEALRRLLVVCDLRRRYDAFVISQMMTIPPNKFATNFRSPGTLGILLGKARRRAPLLLVAPSCSCSCSCSTRRARRLSRRAAPRSPRRRRCPEAPSSLSAVVLVGRGGLHRRRRLVIVEQRHVDPATSRAGDPLRLRLAPAPRRRAARAWPRARAAPREPGLGLLAPPASRRDV